MGGACTKCVHFRRARLASQLLATAFQENTDGAEVASALAKVVDEEHKLREAEAETKSKQESSGTRDADLWPARPMTADFCGLQEADEVYRIPSIKNRGLACADFEEGKTERRACADCVHCVPADGRTRDLAFESTYAGLLNDAVAAQASPQGAQGLLQSYRAGEAARKALEISAVYETKGLPMQEPDYLDHCGALSTEDEYVVCVLRNPYHTCPSWEPKAGPTEGGTPQ